MTKIEGHPYDDMLTEKGFRGFPSLAFMDVEGKVLAQPSGRSVEAFESTLKDLSAWMELKDKASAADAPTEMKWKLFVTEWNLGMLEHEDVKSVRFDGLGEKQQAMLASIRMDSEILELAKAMNTREGREAAVKKVGSRFHEMMKKGHKPGDRAERAFWNGLMSYAEQEQVVDLYAKCVDHFKEMYKDEPRAARYLENLEKKLEEMRAGAGTTP